MVRVLQIVGKMDRAGAETLLMNLYRNIDRDLLQFDFVVHRDEKGDYDDEIKKLGGRIFYLPPMKASMLCEYSKQANSLFSGGEWSIVHSHVDAMSALPLLMAKRAKVPVRIAHSHNTAFPKDKKLPIRVAARSILPYVANRYFGCSEESAKFLFQGVQRSAENSMILNNAIDLEQFRFSADERQRMRSKLNISEESLVLGHIGRFVKQKNHERLLNIFKAVLLQKPNCLLLMAGDGEEVERIKQIASDMGISEKICFLGVRDDIPSLLQAMDCFVLPSLYEGFPVVGVEAQTAGLPCVFSDEIRKDVKLTDKVSFVPLSSDDKQWANTIISVSQLKRNDNILLMKQEGFEITEVAKALQKFYLETADNIRR